MNEEINAEPETRVEYDASSVCERRSCERMVFDDALVSVSVGDVNQKWCPGCVKEEFGLDYPQYSNSYRRFITAKTVWSFVIAVVLTSAIFLLFTF